MGKVGKYKGYTRSHVAYAVQQYLNKDYEKYGLARRISLLKSKMIVDVIFDVIAMILRDNEDKVYISEFGTFKHVVRKERRVKIPKTGEYVLVPEHTELTFMQAQNFGESVKDKTAELPPERVDDSFWFDL